MYQKNAEIADLHPVYSWKKNLPHSPGLPGSEGRLLTSDRRLRWAVWCPLVAPGVGDFSTVIVILVELRYAVHEAHVKEHQHEHTVGATADGAPLTGDALARPAGRRGSPPGAAWAPPGVAHVHRGSDQSMQVTSVGHRGRPQQQVRQPNGPHAHWTFRVLSEAILRFNRSVEFSPRVRVESTPREINPAAHRMVNALRSRKIPSVPSSFLQKTACLQRSSG